MDGHYCYKCDKRVTSHIVEREETYPVKGDPTTIMAKVRICDLCGGDCSDEELEEQTLLAAYDKYRKKHKIISRNQIKAILDKYDISQRSLAALLGWGEITIHRYERGSLPDEAHNQILKFIEDPVNMKKILEEHRERLRPRALKKLEVRLNGIRGRDDRPLVGISRPCNEPSSILTGENNFSADVLRNMILFFAAPINGVLKTKLMKLLWYADFLHFRLFSKSISGTTYVALPFGPAPDEYEYYLSEMRLKNEISIEETMVGGHPAYKIHSRKVPDIEAFPPTAEKVMKRIHEYFSKMGSNEISDLSHQEEGYKKTKKGKPISYKYAEKIKVQIEV